jgi:hypothetical protein
LSIETLLDLDTLRIKDVIGHLKAAEDHCTVPALVTADRKVLLTEEWAAQARERQQGEGSSLAGRGSFHGRCQGKSGKKSPTVAHVMARVIRLASPTQPRQVPQVRQHRALSSGLQESKALGASPPCTRRGQRQ